MDETSSGLRQEPCIQLWCYGKPVRLFCLSLPCQLSQTLLVRQAAAVLFAEGEGWGCSWQPVGPAQSCQGLTISS